LGYSLKHEEKKYEGKKGAILKSSQNMQSPGFILAFAVLFSIRKPDQTLLAFTCLNEKLSIF